MHLREPPRSAEGRASRESRAKGADYLIRHFSGKVNVNYSQIYVSNEEIAIISSSVKTGWGSLNKARTFGRVFTAKPYYLFAYNYDNSITIQNEYDMDADQEFIDILEEVLRSDKRGKGSITSVSEWINAVRNGQGGFIVDYGNGLQNPARGKNFNNMDVGTSKSDTGRHIERGVENDQQKGKASQDLDFVDFLNENLEERERSNHEILANFLETENMSPSEKGFLTKYKNKIAQIEANEAEISEMEAELKELRRVGKKDSSRAITLEGKIEARRKEIARDENMILNLESTKPMQMKMRAFSIKALKMKELANF